MPRSVQQVVATLNDSWANVPGLGPDLFHDRGLALPHPRDCVSVPVAQGVISLPVIVSGLADGRCVRAPIGRLSPLESTDTTVTGRLVSVVLRVKVLRSTHKWEA